MSSSAIFFGRSDVLSQITFKLENGIPVIIANIQKRPQLMTLLIDAIDRRWHLRRENPSKPPIVVVKGNPVVGDVSVELDGHARAKVLRFSVPPFSVFEMLSLLRQVTSDPKLHLLICGFCGHCLAAILRSIINFFQESCFQVV